MKTSFRPFLAGASLSLFLALALAVIAQESPPVAPGPPPPPPAPAAGEPAVEAAAVPAAPAVEAEEPLRRIDQPAANGAVTAEKKAPARRKREVRVQSDVNEFPMGDHHVAKGSRVREVVSIMGTTLVEGEATSDAVSVLGRTDIGPGAIVGGDAVAVLGPLHSQGRIGRDAVSVLGGLDIDGPVGGEVVSVLGDLRLGPNAVVERDIVLVGGKLSQDPSAIVRGKKVHVPIFGSVGDSLWLTAWVKRCVFLARPLAFGANLGWAWLVAFSFLAFYAALALLFRPGIEKCVATFENHPGWSILSSVLTVLLTPVVMVLLVATVVGLLVVPFAGIGLMLISLFGKAVMLAWLGRRITRFFGEGPWEHPAAAILVGGAIVMPLYTVPVFGFLLFKLVSWIGLGVVVYTILLAMKRERLPLAAGAAPAMGGPVAPLAAAAVPLESVVLPAASAPSVSPGFTGAGAEPGPAAAGPASAIGGAATPIESTSGAVPPVPAPPSAGAPAPGPTPTTPIISANTLPRAGFWIRLAALALDGILLGMLVGFVSSLLPRFMQFGHGPGGLFLALAVYGALMWKHRGTTIGGIVCGLKVVRLDQREIDWATAIVRALGCFLSLFVVGLGFIWVGFDAEKQSWHDKIAGTTVVRVPKGVSLL